VSSLFDASLVIKAAMSLSSLSVGRQLATAAAVSSLVHCSAQQFVMQPKHGQTQKTNGMIGAPARLETSLMEATRRRVDIGLRQLHGGALLPLGSVKAKVVEDALETGRQLQGIDQAVQVFLA
jgi:hypothetical protein